MEDFGGTDARNPFGTGEPGERDGWCTPKRIADLLWDSYGLFDIDPCANARSHIRARASLSGPTGSDGCGLLYGPAASADTRPFINCGYSRGTVMQWVLAWRHTDYVFLLRDAPDTEWFGALAAPYKWMPLGWRIEFEPPPGVKTSSNPFPHALFTKSRPPQRLIDAGIAYQRL